MVQDTKNVLFSAHTLCTILARLQDGLFLLFPKPVVFKIKVALESETSSTCVWNSGRQHVGKGGYDGEQNGALLRAHVPRVLHIFCGLFPTPTAYLTFVPIFKCMAFLTVPFFVLWHPSEKVIKVGECYEWQCWSQNIWSFESPCVQSVWTTPCRGIRLAIKF